MEDQPTDSGDLTTDADTASVPQGKAGRTRHRLPRQKAQPVVQGEDDVSTADVAEPMPVEAALPEVEVEAAPAPAPEPAPEPEPELQPEAADAPPKRRRLPWGQRKPADVPAAEVEPDPDVPSDDTADDTADETSRDETSRDETSRDETSRDETSRDETEVAAPEPDAEPEPEPEPVLVPHRPAGRTLKYAAVAAAVLFVAAGAFAGAMVQPYLAERAAAQTKFAVAETAASAITTLWTYTPDDMDKLPERSAKYLGGDFAADYRRYIDAIAAPNKQAQVSNDTQVLGAAVESLTSEEATAIVYTNSVATSPVTKGIPSLRYLSYRLTMKRDDNRWLITQMVAVTKLDLTPQL